MSKKVVAIKLSSGEEVIGRYVETVNSMEFGAQPWKVPTTDIVLEDPRVISIQAAPNGGVGIGFIPYMIANQDLTVTFNHQHITSICPPDENLERGYIGQTSNIKVATPAEQSKIIKKH